MPGTATTSPGASRSGRGASTSISPTIDGPGAMHLTSPRPAFGPVASPPAAMQRIDETTSVDRPRLLLLQQDAEFAGPAPVHRHLSAIGVCGLAPLDRAPAFRRRSPVHTSGVIARSKTVLFRTQTAVTCGSGVNIYYSTFDWNDESLIRRVMSDILADYGLLEAFALRGCDCRARWRDASATTARSSPSSPPDGS